MNPKREALQEKLARAKQELRKTMNDQKIIEHEISRLTRNERTHRLCTRGGMLESFLGEPNLLTDDDVMELLTFLFHGEAAKKKREQLIARRRKQLSDAGGEDP